MFLLQWIINKIIVENCSQLSLLCGHPNHLHFATFIANMKPVRNLWWGDVSKHKQLVMLIFKQLFLRWNDKWKLSVSFEILAGKLLKFKKWRQNGPRPGDWRISGRFCPYTVISVFFRPKLTAQPEPFWNRWNRFWLGLFSSPGQDCFGHSNSQPTWPSG